MMHLGEVKMQGGVCELYASEMRGQVVVCSCVEVKMATVPSLCHPPKTRCGLCRRWRQLEPVSPVVMAMNET